MGERANTRIRKPGGTLLFQQSSKKPLCGPRPLRTHGTAAAPCVVHQGAQHKPFPSTCGVATCQLSIVTLSPHKNRSDARARHLADAAPPTAAQRRRRSSRASPAPPARRPRPHRMRDKRSGHTCGTSGTTHRNRRPVTWWRAQVRCGGRDGQRRSDVTAARRAGWWDGKGDEGGLRSCEGRVVCYM